MKILSTCYKIILILLIIIALYQVIFNNGRVFFGAFYYFRIQSNILVASSLFLFLFMKNENSIKHHIRGITLLAIISTCIISNHLLYRLFLYWGTFQYTFSRTVTHVIAPMGFILDWILFDKHNIMRWKDISIWMVYPIIYCIFSLYASYFYGFSIYFFFKITNGNTYTLEWLSILFCLFLFIGIVVIKVDKIIGYKTKDAM